MRSSAKIPSTSYSSSSAVPVQQHIFDNDLALKIYIKARAKPKLVASFAERREFDKILIYLKQVNMIREATAFLLDVLKPNLPEHAFLQTKFIEINL
ncbi:hypothetical protein OROHE_007633 [Orobanche hederae]